MSVLLIIVFVINFEHVVKYLLLVLYATMIGQRILTRWLPIVDLGNWLGLVLNNQP